MCHSLGFYTVIPTLGLILAFFLLLLSSLHLFTLVTHFPPFPISHVSSFFFPSSSLILLLPAALLILCFIFLLSRDTGDILLKICNLMPQDTGIYTCVAVNDHGSSSSSASIKVQGSAFGLKVHLPKVTCCCVFWLYMFVLLAGIPAAPGRPVAQEASSTAVMVHWPPPASSAHSVVSSYTVEYRQEGVCVCVGAVGLLLNDKWD